MGKMEPRRGREKEENLKDSKEEPEFDTCLADVEALREMI